MHHHLETAFSIDTSAIKFGPGVTREVGYEASRLGARRVAVVTDPRMAKLEPVAVVLDSLRAENIDAVLFDQVEVEPTDESFKTAIEFATQGKFDAFVSVGGGSSMDTAKAANLYSTHPADFLTYVNAPDWAGESCARSSEAAHRRSDDVRHRLRDNRSRDFRLSGDEGQDRPRSPRSQADRRHR